MNIHTKNTILLSLVFSLISSGCSVVGIRSEEQPAYEVLVKSGNKEIRKYQSHIVAKTTITGSFEEAQKKGFRILAGYIFGKNKSKEKIEVTSSTMKEPEKKSNETIAMTAPVIISPEKKIDSPTTNSWVMTFSMPSKYSLKTLPLPTDSRVILEKVNAQYIAALTFSGFWGEKKIESKGELLLNWLKNTDEYRADSKPMFAGYNPPWTLPFFRRNEVLVKLTR